MNLKNIGLILTSLCLTLTGCTTKNLLENDSKNAIYEHNVHELYSCNSFLIHEVEETPLKIDLTKHKSVQISPIWKEIVATLDKDIPFKSKQFQKKLEYIESHPRHMIHILENAAPYIEMVYSKVKKAGLPTEIVIIPMVESMYNPKAQSSAGPGGMWQFTAQTARNFGLKVNKSVDERKDPKKSTEAAVKYLKYLYKLTGGSLDVMIAAYNAGEGRVKRLYKEPEKAGRHTNYSNVKMPDFTRGYLAHIFAYSYYLQSLNQLKTDNKNPEQLIVKRNIKRKWVSVLDFAKHHDTTVRDIESREMYITKTEDDGKIYCEIEFSEGQTPTSRREANEEE